MLRFGNNIQLYLNFLMHAFSFFCKVRYLLLDLAWIKMSMIVQFQIYSFIISYFFYFSIMPETFIEPHKVLSPLPKHLPALQMLVKTIDVTQRLSDVSSLSASSSIGTGSSSSSDRIRYSTKFYLYFQLGTYQLPSIKDVSSIFNLFTPPKYLPLSPIFTNQPNNQ